METFPDGKINKFWSELLNLISENEIKIFMGNKRFEVKSRSTIFYLLYYYTYDTEYLYELKDIAEKDNLDYRSNIYLSKIIKNNELYGLSHEAYILDNKKSQDFIKLMIQKMKKNNEFKDMLKYYKEASHKIAIIKGDSLLSSTIIVKEWENPFDREIEIRNKLEEILRGEALLPTIVDYFEDQNKFYYVMELEGGETLMDLMNKNSVPSNIYEEILEIMAKIHVLFPIDNMKNYDLRSLISKRIDNSILKVENCENILEVLSKSKNLCYNKSSTADNWIVRRTKEGISKSFKKLIKNTNQLNIQHTNSDNIVKTIEDCLPIHYSKSSKKADAEDYWDIICIDTEDKGVVPCAVDLAQFLNFVSDIKNRINYANKYIERFNLICKTYNKADRKIENKEQFMKEFYNASIFRSITTGAYLNSKKRSEETTKIKLAGVEMIDYMLQNNLIENKNLKDYVIIKKFLM